MDLPVYKLVCNEFDPMQDMERVDLVDRPAIMENWMLFSQLPDEQQFKFAADEEQRIITGPVMIPDVLIKRFQPVKQGGEPIYFYAVADKATIRATAKMYARNKKLGDVGLMHEQRVNEGVYMFQSFVSDLATGIQNPTAFSNLPDGTWFMSFLVDDDNLWNAAKEGKLNGFSIQALFGLEPDGEHTEIAAQLLELESDLQKIATKMGVAIQ